MAAARPDLKGTTSSGLHRNKIVLSREEEPNYIVSVPPQLNRSAMSKLQQVEPFASAAVMLQAIAECDMEEFTRCLSFCGTTNKSTTFQVDEKNSFGQTCLHIACQSGLDDAVKQLLKAKADPLIRCLDGQNATSYAAKYGNSKSLETLSLFFKSRSRPSVELLCPDRSGRSPVILAAAAGHAKCIGILAQMKADFDAQDKLGLTACHHAARQDHGDVIRALHSCKANLRKLDACAKEPLATAGINEKQNAKSALVQLLDFHNMRCSQ